MIRSGFISSIWVFLFFASSSYGEGSFYDNDLFPSGTYDDLVKSQSLFDEAQADLNTWDGSSFEVAERRRKIKKKKKKKRLKKKLRRSKKKKRRRKRRFASFSQNSSLKGRASQRSLGDKDFMLRLLVGGGLSSVSASDEQVQQNLDENKLSSNLYTGLNADVRYKYFGLDLDVFYGIAPTSRRTTEERTEEFKLRQSSIYANLKGQYPFRLGSTRLIPKIGVGYAVTSLSQKISIQDSELGDVNTTVTDNVKGIYPVLGVDFEPIRELIFSVDFATSLSASGTSSGTDQEDQELENVNFNRLRVGVLYRAFGGFLVGGQFAKRGVGSDANDSSLTQFVGLIGYQF